MKSPPREQQLYFISIHKALKKELEFEAWEEGLHVMAYVRKLLANRRKLARGGYALLKPK
jgi:hypothetical protein